jgi:hypothetical protein
LNRILVGSEVHQTTPSSQRDLVQIVWKKGEWRHNSRITGEIYFGIQCMILFENTTHVKFLILLLISSEANGKLIEPTSLK